MATLALLLGVSGDSVTEREGDAHSGSLPVKAARSDSSEDERGVYRRSHATSELHFDAIGKRANQMKALDTLYRVRRRESKLNGEAEEKIQRGGGARENYGISFLYSLGCLFIYFLLLIKYHLHLHTKMFPFIS